jgi:osmotically-inducible protein OsmY
MSRSLSRRLRIVAGAVLTATALTACAPLLIGGAMVGTTLVVTDRRTSGTQLEDETIEIKARNRASEVLGDRGSVSATSYNRLVLLTGEVRSDADKANVEQAVARIDNVRSVVNELAVLGESSLTSRSSDAILSGKVKASFVDAKDLQANTLKVVTERGIVYLMGIVTEREANRAADIARGVSGVQKVVRVFEVISEAELANLQPRPKN